MRLGGDDADWGRLGMVGNRWVSLITIGITGLGELGELGGVGRFWCTVVYGGRWWKDEIGGDDDAWGRLVVIGNGGESVGFVNYARNHGVG